MPKRRSEDALWKLLDGSPDEWLKFIGAFLALGAMIWLIVRIKTWLQGGEDPAEGDQSLLMQFSELHREGELTEEEYRSIKGRLVARLDGSLRPESPESKLEQEERKRDGRR